MVFPTETGCNPQFKLKVTKNNFPCIHCPHCADKEHFNTLPDDTQCNCYSLLTTVSKYDMHSSFNIAATL